MKISAIEGTLKKGALKKAYREIEHYRRRCAMKISGEGEGAEWK